MQRMERWSKCWMSYILSRSRGEDAPGDGTFLKLDNENVICIFVALWYKNILKPVEWIERIK